jgi:hypothetical protein
MPIEQIKTSRSGIGPGSGVNTKASGRYSTALGYGTNARGAYSTVSGNSGVASGENATASGNACTASGGNSFAVGSYSTASGAYSAAIGYLTASSGLASFSTGNGSAASGSYSVATGYQSNATRYAQASHSGSYFSTKGDAQNSRFVLSAQTTDATPTELSISSNIYYIDIGATRTMSCEIKIAAHRTDVSGTAAAWPSITCGITRDATGNCRLLGTPTGAGTTTFCDAGATTWSVAITAPTSNRLAITVTGEADKTIRWVASVDMAEVG